MSKNSPGSITEWVNAWNENPRPYVWHKTADETIDSLADIANESLRQDTRSSEMTQRNADVVILGGGSGGYSAAIRASELGLSVIDRFAVEVTARTRDRRPGPHQRPGADPRLRSR